MGSELAQTVETDGQWESTEKFLSECVPAPASTMSRRRADRWPPIGPASRRRLIQNSRPLFRQIDRLLSSFHQPSLIFKETQ